MEVGGARREGRRVYLAFVDEKQLFVGCGNEVEHYGKPQHVIEIDVARNGA